jgi:hypothetical protein
VSAFGYNQSAGTTLVEVDTFSDSGNPIVYSIDDGAYQDSIATQVASSYQFIAFNNGVNQAQIDSGNITINTATKISSAYAANDFASSMNGSTAVTDTAGAVPIVTQMRIGNYSLGAYLNGHIKSIQYFPRRLTNAQLQELTQ